MTVDALTLIMMIAISLLSGSVVYLLLSMQKQPVESVNNSLGEYFNSPLYSQGVVDFYRKLIREWVTIQFQGWKNTHNMDFSNRDHFRKLTAKILLEFFDDYSLQKNVQFQYCLFTESYLISYISMQAMEMMTKLVEAEVSARQEET